MTTRTLMVMAGGTGGHVFPGLAVANYLRERNWKVVWLGNPKGMEATLVPTHGIEVKGIQFGGLRGKGLFTKLLLPLNLLRAFAQSIRVLRQVKPDVVLGMGGYITFPAGMMAVLLGRPLVLHEQNSIAGLANKVLAKVSDATLVAFPNALPDAEWVGNPIRAEICAIAAPAERYTQRTGPLKGLVIGGSLGAQALNEIVPAALAKIAGDLRPTMVHQTGKGNSATVQALYDANGVNASATDFIQDMAQAYQEADFVISRSGAMAVSEIAAVGIASLLVPYPHAVDDHQTTNAQFLSATGAAELIQQNSLNAQSLAQWIEELNREKCLAMATKARALAKPEATAQVARVCEAWAKR
jgi:UDP-N-acetylglucosamine--N-acetylmuramyl-(pentapeptide) pyrophosphoryl-undecaprenol N-acetylglucosamine transferase